MSDRIRRFMLAGAPVRGESVSLDAAWRAVLERHADLPAAVRDCLGELSAAAVLLAATLKFDGSLVLQIHGDGPVALVVVECQGGGQFRATVKLREGPKILPDDRFDQLVNRHGQGRFVVTLDPRGQSPNRQPYQGIIPLTGQSVSEVLEHYMASSEQVPTRLWLAADAQRASGLLLQRLPDHGGRATSTQTDATQSEDERDADGWNRLQKLAETITRDELLQLGSPEVLRRLFWQEQLHSHDEAQLRFHCACSREKVAGMLKMLGRTEVESILSERPAVDVNCDFCNQAYAFDPVDCATLFLEDPLGPASATTH
jgi:molecular chaperone Hsp33